MKLVPIQIRILAVLINIKKVLSNTNACLRIMQNNSPAARSVCKI